MDGRPERAQTNVRLVRRAQPRATRSHALPLTVTIVVITVFVAALFTRATGSGAALIGPWDPPVGRPESGPEDGGSPTPRCAITWLCRSFSEGTSSAPPATSVAPLPSSSPIATMPQLPGLPVRRRARRPRGLRRLAAHDRRYDEPTAEGLRAAGPRAGFPGGSVRRWLHSAHRDRGSQGPRGGRAEGRGATRGRVGLPERGPAAKDVRGLGTHLRRSRGQTFQCARRTLGAPARDRHRFQGRGRRVPVDAGIRALAPCAMAGGQRLAVRLDPELSAGCRGTDLLRR